jgi:acyl transferase domain-containing protein
MTVPGVDAQAALLREAYRLAGFPAGRVAYVEAHGIGTPVGDPIEATALGRVLGEGRPAGQKCLIGSVKTNVGHLEAGSGIAGLIKAALVAYRRTVPPSLNFEQPNPHIPFETLPLEVASRLQPLPQENGHLPVTAVNSFGFGGTNAHVVLEAAPPDAPGRADRERADRPCLLPISARDDESLRRYAAAYRDHLADPARDLSDVCYSAGARKEHHERRLVVMGRSAAEIRRRLGVWLTGAAVKGVTTGRCSAALAPLVFVFTGQGAQWWAMGRQLLAREPVFRRALEAVDAAFQPLSGWSLLDVMRCPEAESPIEGTDVAQPAIFALQVALAELWQAWGIRPDKVIGHSVGEVAAACVAGIYSLADAAKILYHRGRLQHTTGGRGRMLAVGLSAGAAAC